jgi:hypothetical protein
VVVLLGSASLQVMGIRSVVLVPLDVSLHIVASAGLLCRRNPPAGLDFFIV